MMTITLTDVLFAYPNTQGKPLLNIPHWSVESGQQLFIHGPSGSGKSTLLNILSGLHMSTSGKVEILGERLDKMSVRQRDCFRAKHIGYVFQQFNLISYLNAVENVQLAMHFGRDNPKMDRKDIENMLASLNLSANDWHKPTHMLSIGQQQRVAIARALINKPELVIADEPTSSLDQHNRDTFISTLLSFTAKHQITLVFVSHDLSLSQHFNRVEALSDISASMEAVNVS